MSYIDYLLEVISGKIEFNSELKTVYTIDKQILLKNELDSNVKFITSEKYEEYLYESCANVINKFSVTESNNNVYAAFLYIDIDGGVHGLIFATEEEYDRIGHEKLYPEMNDTIWSEKYNSGCFKNNYYGERLNTEEFNEVNNAYYAINNDHCITTVHQNIGFEKSMFESKVAQIGLNVMKKIKSSFESLDLTENFICSVQLHDESSEIRKKYLEECNELHILKSVFVEFR